MMDEGRKLEPFTVKVKPGPPIVRFAGLNPEITGAATRIVKLLELEDPPPGEELNTVIIAVPAEAMSPAGISALNCVFPIKFVGRLDPFHCTTDDVEKLDPTTVNVNAGPPISCVDGLNELRIGMGFIEDGVDCRLVCLPPLHEIEKKTKRNDRERPNTLEFLSIKISCPDLNMKYLNAILDFI
jgi:hypothetical protein